MPNAKNISSPITLLGIGRSGTTLLEASFRAHPNVQSIGESADMIFSAANGAELSAIPSRHKFTSVRDYRGYVVQQLLVAIEGSEKEIWFHKPAGIPKLIPWGRLPGEKSTGGFPIEWYWDVLEAAFPEAKYLICLRNPWDVVLSWERFRGWEQKHLWRDVLITYRILAWRLHRFTKLLFFEDLVSRPAETLHEVFRSVDLPMIDQALRAFEQPRSMNGNKVMATHREAWDTCQPPNVSQEEAEVIVSVWKAFGRSFESPSAYASTFRF